MTGPIYDVVIVGAGPAGAVAALRLVEAGMKVLCLEQGGWPDRSDYRGAEKDWELSARDRWAPAPGIRRGPTDYPIDLTGSDIGVLNYNGVGGGTVLYAAQWPRPLPSDFRVRSEDGVADDWPVDYDELAPFFERTDAAFGVSGLGGNPAYPAGDEPPHPPLPIGRAGMKVARAHRDLGWHWWPEPNAILSVESGERHQCVQRGTCMQGCGESAKGSADVTHWPHIIELGGELLTHATVTRILTDDRGLACGVEWVNADGRDQACAADVVLLAANGIGTPRLLLASAHPGAPDGLANSSGLVGRRLMLHSQSMVFGLFDDDLGSWQGHWGASIQSLEFYGTDTSRGFVRGAKWGLAPTGGPLRAAVPPGRRREWGNGHHELVRSRLGRSIMWGVLAEDLPEEHNRVELADTTDRIGLPGAKVSYTVSDNTSAITEWNIERASESLLAAGATSLEIVRGLPTGHLMGTARMGDDPASSVVDRWGMSHDIPNLGIVDGSVFVTSAAVNPTSLIAALALRTAEHLVTHRSSLPTPHHGAAAITVERPDEAPAAVTGAPVQVSPKLRSTHRDRLALWADRLIPADDRMPAATAVGVDGALVDAALRAAPSLEAPLLRALDSDSHDLEELARYDAAAAEALCTVVAGAYYMSDDVRERIGYPGQVAQPGNPHEFPDYITEGLLDHLVN